EWARAMLRKMLAHSEHGLLLSYDGERILGRISDRARWGRAGLVNAVNRIAWILFAVAVCCALFAMTPLPAAFGSPGWFACTIIGVGIGLAVARCGC
ncbi:MAG TPA: hypothetical protein VF590_23385, partial [Isosphaeraceae bacterium]